MPSKEKSPKKGKKMGELRLVIDGATWDARRDLPGWQASVLVAVEEGDMAEFTRLTAPALQDA